MKLHKLGRITFLLGSGSSIPAGMPSTKEMTKEILSGNNFLETSESRRRLLYVNLESLTNLNKKNVEELQKFLRKIKCKIANYYRTFDQDPNYEDLYWVVSQIGDSDGEYLNPIVEPFISEMGKKCQIIELSHQARELIRFAVWRLLGKNPSNLDALKILRGPCSDEDISRIDIFTLNHDRVLENFLSNEKIAFTDGFSKPKNKVRYWEYDLYARNSHKVRICKLHGSVDYFQFGDKRKIGILQKGDPGQTKGPKGITQKVISRLPMMLIGTTNKILDYVTPFYARLLILFYSSLLDSSRLVICGYGFGDREIDTQIDIMLSYTDSKIILVDPEMKKLKKRSTAILRSKWNQWKANGRLFVIEQKIEDTSWKDIKQL